METHRFQRPDRCIECGRPEEDPIHEEICDLAREQAYAELAKTWGDD